MSFSHQIQDLFLCGKSLGTVCYKLKNSFSLKFKIFFCGKSLGTVCYKLKNSFSLKFKIFFVLNSKICSVQVQNRITFSAIEHDW